jgi:hypothetical protein
LLLILSSTACTASALTSMLAKLEPLLALVDILEEIQCWGIKIVDLYFVIRQTLPTFIKSPKLGELL